jgi:hypothetical protein
MELKNLIKTGQFLEEMSKSIERINWKSFPQLSREERKDISQRLGSRRLCNQKIL